MKVNFYKASEKFKSIEQHIAVTNDELELVAIFGINKFDNEEEYKLWIESSALAIFFAHSESIIKSIRGKKDHKDFTKELNNIKDDVKEYVIKNLGKREEKIEFDIFRIIAKKVGII